MLKKIVVLLLLATSMFIFSQEKVSVPLNDLLVLRKSGKTEFIGGIKGRKGGEPDLPMLKMSILIPNNWDENSISVKLENVIKEELRGEFSVEPAPPIVIDGKKYYDTKKNIVDGKDAYIYNLDDFYPSNDIDTYNIGKLNNFKIVDIIINPYSYNPITGKIIKLVNADLVISETNSRHLYSETYPGFTSLDGFETVSKSISNMETLNSYIEPVMLSESIIAPKKGFVVITTNDINNNSSYLSEFLDIKRSMGYETHIVTETEWGGGIGDIASENIRDWLKSNRVALNIHYVLLIGNPHPLEGEVPMKLTTANKNAGIPFIEDIPTDYYYAELSGDWDLDNDGIYGEYKDDLLPPGGADEYPEVIVGRIPFYGNYDDLDKILFKTIKYVTDKEGNIGWRESGLAIKKPLSEWDKGVPFIEFLKNRVFVPNSYNFTRVIDTINAYNNKPIPGVFDLNPLPEYMSCNVNNVLKAWNSKPMGVVVWSTHGSSSNASGIMDSSSSKQLSDKFPSIVFQASCSNAYPEDEFNLAYSVLKNAAVATIGGTRLTWGNPLDNDYFSAYGSSAIGIRYANNVITKKMPLGEALIDANSSGYPYDTWFNRVSLNLYGSPGITISNTDKLPDTCIYATIKKQPKKVNNPYPYWNEGNYYVRGDRVKHNGFNWEATQWTVKEPKEINDQWLNVGNSISYKDEDLGSIFPRGVVDINPGQPQTIIFSPIVGYEVKEVIVDGVAITPVPQGSYTFSDVNEYHTLVASFGEIVESYSIVSSAGENGKIYPLGSNKFVGEKDTTFDITPDNGYVIDKVLVDGRVAAENQYQYSHTFPMLSGNHKIEASFKKMLHYSPRRLTIESNVHDTIAKTYSKGIFSPASYAELQSHVFDKDYFEFSHWEVVSGVVKIEDVYSPKTKIIIPVRTGTIRIKAYFNKKADPITMWHADKDYEKGRVVKYNSSLWEARWWTRNEEPGKNKSWLKK